MVGVVRAALALGALAVAGCTKGPIRVALEFPPGATAMVVVRGPADGRQGPWSAVVATPGTPFDDGLAMAAYDGTGIVLAAAAVREPLDQLPLAPGPLRESGAGATFTLRQLQPYWTATARVDGAVERDVALRQSELPTEVADRAWVTPCPTATVAPDSEVHFEWFARYGCPVPFPARPRMCFGAPREIGEIRTGTVALDPSAHAPTPLLIDGRLSLITPVTTVDVKIWESLERHAVIPMRSPIEPEGEATLLGDLPPFMKVGADWTVGGWTSRVFVRGDGLEMFFSGSYPDRNWRDEEMYVATRASLSAPWGPGIVLDSLTRLDQGLPDDPSHKDPGSSPLLLQDRRTLLFIGRNYTGPQLTALHWAMRRSTRAGDAEFVDIGEIRDEARLRCADCHPARLSCDGSSIIFHKDAEGMLIAKITTFPSYEEGSVKTELVVDNWTTPYPAPPPPLGTSITDLAEVPDCSGIYYAVAPRTYRPSIFAPRVDCP